MIGKIVSGLLVVVLALSLAACAPAAAPTATPAAKPASVAPTSKPAAAAPTPAPATPTPQPVKLKVGSLGGLSDAGNFIADKKGYFKEQGIEVEFVKFNSGAQQIAPLGTGELDVGRGAITAGLFNAIIRGIDIKIVADANTTFPNRLEKDSNVIVVRKDLADQIKTEKDLKGRNIGRTAAGTVTEVELFRLLEKGGLSVQDVNLQFLGMPDGVAALGGKSIDAYVSLTEPSLTQAIEKGVAVYWKGYSEIYPNHTIAVLMYPPKFTKEKPDAARSFAVAYLRGVRDYYDAFFKNKNKKEIAAILAEMTDVKDLTLYDKMAPQYMNPDGYVNSESVASDAKYFFQGKQIEKEVDTSKVVDNSFMDFAIQKLGKFQR